MIIRRLIIGLLPVFLMVALTSLGQAAPGAESSSTAGEKFDPSGATFVKTQQERMQSLTAQLKQILAVKEPRTVKNTLEPLRKLNLTLSNGMSESELFAQVHADETIRKAAQQFEQDFEKFGNEQINLNRELYDAVKSVKIDDKDPQLTFFYNQTLLDYRHAGVDRDEQTRKKIGELNELITASSQAFSINLQQDVRRVTVKADELKGLPQDYITTRVKPDKAVVITTDYPDVTPVMLYAENSDVRRKVYEISHSRGYPQNVDRLTEVLRYRYELAKLLGYKNYAAYDYEKKMVANQHNAEDFLQKISAIAKPRAEQDYKEMLAAKKLDDKSADHLDAWDWTYYNNKLLKQRIGLDNQELRPYFPYEGVKKGVFAVAEKMYGFKIEKLTNMKAWHPSVEAYVIKSGKQEIGRFYLDMFPRANKYKHSAQFNIHDGLTGLQSPISAIVCNFPAPTASDPGLLEHGDVETFFHEFGHLVHMLTSGHNRWNGGMEWDFVEMPSQLNEEWGYQQGALALFARHYQTGAVLPNELIKKINLARKFGLGYSTATQIYYASISVYFHTTDPSTLDAPALAKSLWNDNIPTPFPEGTHFIYSFDHLMGYGPSYYTYLWSLVIAKDVFGQFQQEGLFNRQTALRYLDKTLSPTGTEKASTLIEGFLHRPYSFDAYAKYLGDH